MIVGRAVLRVVFVGSVGFFVCCGWEVIAGRHDDLELGGFVAVELVVDGREGVGGAGWRCK